MKRTTRIIETRNHMNLIMRGGERKKKDHIANLNK